MYFVWVDPGYSAQVDEEDYERCTQFRWFTPQEREKGIGPTANVYGTLMPMGRFIYGEVPAGMQIDHLNWNRFDNRKANLVLCVSEQNCQRVKPRPHSSKYKGVNRSSKVPGKFEARIRCGNGKRIQLGTFLSETEAALAYDRAALKYYGPLAYTNF